MSKPKKGYSSSYKPQPRAYYMRARKAVLASGQDMVCAHCETCFQIEVHHRDGDITNNNIENLEPLCRSCHMILHETGLGCGRWS